MSGWATIPVPSNWEFEGYGYPVYRDEFYSFPANPPFIPHDDTRWGRTARTSRSRPAGRRESLHQFDEVYSHFCGNGE